ncbi:AP-3 complex subunit delta [Ceratocystis fimbriata CBS 114723]|uniref:AP-3 complex subunit delta n=1 Tax=Ceratocystis fimbriata CBS 114723 TaxID=1035309 RepID=A0A2C5X4W2_9PEZI|nr:AP-3 complex subunit delta [Ceratocystis fimbriata CBS 114723]
MFEKSLYDLIRGLRNHKGNEREYIQNCLKECRAEIKGPDLDIKATALLKVVYLEMIGFDMSWASFHVLEVMSSAKYRQKRVGYLAAAQSFRSDTEVLMLATNLMKKDLGATAGPVMTLPIATLPHVLNPSLAMSTQMDLMPRLNHSNPNIRKKAIVTLYRMALVYPETLVAAWPKIKERLMDKNEDASVTAAIVSVVCELGWRRPHDFLPLAPRLFELLVDAGNNWMAIKLIKLFATLTPLEPRLVRKLLPPLTGLIRTTPAMSLLYECINGIIQGGILSSDGEDAGREEIATLCVEKLRSMIMVDGDPNLKYVALLAFNKIVITHAYLVAQQEDVILDCIDSADITIRVKALDLVQGMVTSENLITIVGRLMRQLKSSKTLAEALEPEYPAGSPENYDDDESQSQTRKPKAKKQEPPLPEGYQIDVIGKILNMCTQDNYSNIVDFDWYMDVLTQLVRVAPTPQSLEGGLDSESTSHSPVNLVVGRIGDEIRNLAVKVKAMRPAVVQVAERILTQITQDSMAGHQITCAALRSISWVIGEYAECLLSDDVTLSSLLQIISRTNCPSILMNSIQAAVKVFSSMTSDENEEWSPARKTRVSLLLARVLHTLEPLSSHPNLEIQERAVQFVELLKLASEAVNGQPPTTNDVEQDPPLLLTQAIPSLFNSWEIKSMAPGAQFNVPLPPDLDLDTPIHPDLAQLLSRADFFNIEDAEADDFDLYYHQKAAPNFVSSEYTPAISKLPSAPDSYSGSYQQSEDDYLDPDIVARRKAERAERNKDDPFYIGADSGINRTSTPIHNILHDSNGDSLDIDAIPVMQLDLTKLSSGSQAFAPKSRAAPPTKSLVVVAADETLGSSGASSPHSFDTDNRGSGSRTAAAKKAKTKQSLLGVDSSSLATLSLTEPSGPESTSASINPYEVEKQKQDEVEMAKAMKEVERLRLQMQRANERVQVAQGVNVEGVVIKKKAKTKTKKSGAVEGDGNGDAVAKKNKKKKAMAEGAEGGAVIKPKKKKKKKKADSGDSVADVVGGE